MKQPLRILYLIDSLATGGAERMAVRIANLMAPYHQVHLIPTRKEGLFKKDVDEKVHYHFLAKKSAWDISAFWRLYRYIKKNKIQIVHAHSTSVYMVLLLKKLFLRNLKIVWHDHHGYPVQKRVGYKLLKRLASGIDFMIAVNKEQLENNLEQLSIKKALFLRNFAWLNNDFFKEKENKMVLLGSWRRVKNTLLGLKAFSVIHKKFPGWKFLLIGYPAEPDYGKEVKDFVFQNNIRDQVEIISGESDISPYLYSSKIGILSSKAEGLPVALLEYGLAELGVVTTRVGGIPQLIQHGKTGLLVPPDDVNAFAQALETLMTDEKLRSNLASNLKAEVEKNYSARSYREKLEEIYYSLL